MAELKACPFCGEPGEIVKGNLHPYDRYFTPVCSNGECVAHQTADGEFGYYDNEFTTKEEAIAAWNNRAVDPLARELAEALSVLFEATRCDDCLERTAPCPDPCGHDMGMAKAALAHYRAVRE